jgi:putative NADPH-quinone reductase
LYKLYPDGNIDVIAEQKMIEQYDKVVFQFPVYWFSCPSLLKKWIDDVLIYGWAYGSKSGYKMSGKKVTLAMSVGVDEYEYNPNEKYRYTLKDLTRPFDLTFEYVKADYQPFFAYYGIELNTSQEWIEKSVPLYLDFLESL